MCKQENATENSTSELIDAVQVEVVSHLNLLVKFEDGVAGNVKISPAWLTGVFSSLNDEEAFSNVFVEHGAVTWANGLDLAPDSMYDAIKHHGEYYLC